MHDIAFYSLYLVVCVEAYAMVSGFIFGYTFPDGVALLKTRTGEIRRVNIPHIYTIGQRVRMCVMRWLYVSPMAHEFYCITQGQKPLHKGTSVAFYSMTMAVLFLAAGYGWDAFGLGLACGIAVFASSQLRAYASMLVNVEQKSVF